MAMRLVTLSMDSHNISLGPSEAMRRVLNSLDLCSELTLDECFPTRVSYRSTAGDALVCRYENPRDRYNVLLATIETEPTAGGTVVRFHVGMLLHVAITYCCAAVFIATLLT